MKAGVATANITPPVGVDMTGFGGRPSPCVGVHDDLYARALVLDNGDARIGIVTTDLLSLARPIVERVREAASESLGIAPHALMLNSSHTHSGPATIYLRGLGDLDEAYCDCLSRKIVGALRMAVDDLEDAPLRFGVAPVQVGDNRRERMPDGSTKLGVNITGAVCEDVQVLRVDLPDGGAKALLFAHAAHPVVLRGANVLISRDYVGYAVDGVEALMGPAVTALFAQGCCGNINAGGRDTFEVAAGLGRLLAGATAVAAERAQPMAGDALAGASTQLQLPYLSPPSQAEAQAQLDQARAALAALNGKDVNRGQRMVAEGLVAWAEDMLAVVEGRLDDPSARFEVQALRIGDAAVVSLEGEVFVEYATNIRAASPFEHTMVLAYTNGCIGYVPTAAAYPDGGYEVNTAYRYYGIQMIAPESERVILDEAQRLLAVVQD